MTEDEARMTIRDATSVDAGACAAIYAPYVRETAISFESRPPSRNEMSRLMEDALASHAWLVAEFGDVVGYAYGHAFAARAAYRWSVETSIYLDREHCGRGVGRALYEELLDRLAARGYCRALAGVTLPNDASVGLHRALGFQEVGVYQRIGWKLGAWHDVAWFQRDIGPETEPPDATK
jgi:L-amino acid N-acyltransferase YncA